MPYTLGCFIVMMTVYSSTALKVSPPFQVYDSDTLFTSLLCVNNDDSPLASDALDDIEWLYSNFTSLTTTQDFRIDGIIQLARLFFSRLLLSYSLLFLSW